MPPRTLAALALLATAGTPALAVAAQTASPAGAAPHAARHPAGDPAAAVAAAREALHAVWLDAPLGVTKAVLAKGESNGYGMYEPRGGNRYAPGEPVVIYVEPIGYKYRREGELWHFGVAVDLLVIDKAGKIIGGREGFLRKDLASRNPVTEFGLSLSYSLGGLPPGTYVLRTTLHDFYGDGQARFENEIEIVPAGSG